MAQNYLKIDQQDCLAPFDLENSPNAANMPEAVYEIIKEICNVGAYRRALLDSGIDMKAMPFSNLERGNLLKAREICEKLHDVLNELEGMNPRPYADKERQALQKAREKMWSLSSRFYEYVPHEEFRNKMVPPISTVALLEKKTQMITSLIEIELASKILLGAHKDSAEMNPYEYCYKALHIRLEVLDKNQGGEQQLIRNYCENTLPKREGRVAEILKVTHLKKSGEEEKKNDDQIDNRMLLFHGSQTTNFIGILKQGVKPVPIGADQAQAPLGRAAYFTDCLLKSVKDCRPRNQNANAMVHGIKYVAICEVSLGNTSTVNRPNPLLTEAPEDSQSVLGVGREGPELKKLVTLPDGGQVPCGKMQVFGQERANSSF